MSANIVPLQTVKVIDPLFDFNKPKVYSILKGGSWYNWQNQPAANASNVSFTINAPPPSPETVIDRRVLLQIPVTLTFSGTSTDNQLLHSGYDSFRAYPLHSILQSLTVQVNGAAETVNMYDCVSALTRYLNPPEALNDHFSMSPALWDQSQNYNDLEGALRNPLAYYGDSIHGSTEPRGAFAFDVVSNNSTSAVVSATLTEEIMISPLMFGKGGYENGFVGVQTFNVYGSYISDLSYIWSHMNSKQAGVNYIISSINVQLGTASLWFKYGKSSLLDAIPRSIEYPYFHVNPRSFAFANNTFTAGKTISGINSGNFQLGSVPRRVMIWVRQRNQDRTYLTTDTFLSIQSLSVAFDNVNNYFSSANITQLYQIAMKNGLKGTSYSQFIGGPTNFISGNTNTPFGGPSAPLVLEFGTDIPLTDQLAPGVLGNFNFAVTLSVYNPNLTETIVADLYIMTIEEGVFNIYNQVGVLQIGVLTKEQVLNSMNDLQIPYDELVRMDGMPSGAGSFFGDVGRFFRSAGRNVGNAIQKALPYIKEYGPKILEYAEKYGPLLAGLGAEVGGVYHPHPLTSAEAHARAMRAVETKRREGILSSEALRGVATKRARGELRSEALKGWQTRRAHGRGGILLGSGMYGRCESCQGIGCTMCDKQGCQGCDNPDCNDCLGGSASMDDKDLERRLEKFENY